MSFLDDLASDMDDFFLADFGEDVVFTAGKGATPVTITGIVDRDGLETSKADRGRTMAWKMGVITSINKTPLSAIANKGVTFLLPRRVGETPRLYSGTIVAHDAGAVTWGLQEAN